MVVELIEYSGEIKTSITYPSDIYQAHVDTVIDKWVSSGSVHEDDPDATTRTIFIQAHLAPVFADNFFSFFPDGYEYDIFSPVKVSIHNGQGRVTYPKDCIDCFDEIKHLLASPSIVNDYNFLDSQGDEIDTLKVPLDLFDAIKDHFLPKSKYLIRMIVSDSNIEILYPSQMSGLVIDVCDPLLIRRKNEEYGLDHE